MAKYEVEIVKKTIETQVFKVEANSEDEAKSKVLNTIKGICFDYFSLGESTNSTITDVRKLEND